MEHNQTANVVGAGGNSSGAGSQPDTGGNSSGASATSTPPTITLSGANPADIFVGATYIDLGAVAKDNAGHDLGYFVSVDGRPPRLPSCRWRPPVPGNQTISIYTATDTYGNTATAERQVTVSAPATATTPTTETTASTTETTTASATPDTSTTVATQ